MRSAVGDDPAPGWPDATTRSGESAQTNESSPPLSWPTRCRLSPCHSRMCHHLPLVVPRLSTSTSHRHQSGNGRNWILSARAPRSTGKCPRKAYGRRRRSSF